MQPLRVSNIISIVKGRASYDNDNDNDLLNIETDLIDE